MMKGNPNVLKFDDLIIILLQEDQSKKNRTKTHVLDQAFIDNQKGKEKALNDSKQKATSLSSTRVYKYEEKRRYKFKYNYYKVTVYYTKEWS